MVDYAYVYILSNSFRKLYIGMTTDLQLRVKQHKEKKNPECHTARYGIDRLVYFERFSLVVAAIRREKVLKGWLRRRKLELIITTNPLWKDLSEDWGKMIIPPDLSEERAMWLARAAALKSEAVADNAGVLHSVQDDGEEQDG